MTRETSEPIPTPDRIARPLSLVQAIEANLVCKELIVNNRRVNTFIDTGSGVSVLSDDLARELGSLFPWEGHSVILANGEDLKPTWVIKLSVSTQERRDKWVETKAVVLPLGEMSLLLGNNVLKQLGTLIVDYDLNGKPVVEFKPPARSVQPDKALDAADDVNIPAFAALAVKVNRKSPDEGLGGTEDTSAVLEPSAKLFLQQGISLGHAVVSDTEQVVLVNLSGQEQTVRKGTTVAFLTSAESIIENWVLNEEKTSNYNWESDLPFSERINPNLTVPQGFGVVEFCIFLLLAVGP